MNPTLGTEPSNAPQTRQRTIERQGNYTEPHVVHLPRIIGGVCEFCGILDRNVASQDQWRLCEHYRGVPEIRCSYCEDSVNTADVVRMSDMLITEHPDDHSRLIVCCNRFTCADKHIRRFRVNR